MMRQRISGMAATAVFVLAAISLTGPLAAQSAKQEGCTVIGAGRLATVDGSVITSHSDCCSECRIQVIPARTFPKGSLAPVHWGMVYFGAEDDRHALPLGEFGQVIGQIPQVERTFAYFHTGYSQMNEKQLAIGESTCSQRAELDVAFVEGLTRQIMTIEQAQVFALERCATAREAVKLIGALVEKYGFLPSCGGSEALCIADPRELWTMEICSVGSEWTPESGKPGAIWAARRVPDDHVVVIANYFRIREIDVKSPDTLASPNYMKEAVDRGWYDPKSGRPFVWQEAYAPPVREGNLSRMWLITSTLAPSLKAWPKRSPRRRRRAGHDLRPALRGRRLLSLVVQAGEEDLGPGRHRLPALDVREHDLRHDLGPGLDGPGRRRPHGEEPDGLAVHLRRHGEGPRHPPPPDDRHPGLRHGRPAPVLAARRGRRRLLVLRRQSLRQPLRPGLRRRHRRLAVLPDLRLPRVQRGLGPLGRGLRREADAAALAGGDEGPLGGPQPGRGRVLRGAGRRRRQGRRARQDGSGRRGEIPDRPDRLPDGERSSTSTASSAGRSWPNTAATASSVLSSRFSP